MPSSAKVMGFKSASLRGTWVSQVLQPAKPESTHSAIAE
jgi:hypothetical protein